MALCNGDLFTKARRRTRLWAVRVQLHHPGPAVSLSHWPRFSPRRPRTMDKTEETDKVSRRGALKTGAGLALGGMLGSPDSAPAAPKSNPKSVYEAIGVKHIINATGTVTTLGGSLMPPEVVAAWSEAAKHFVDLSDLQEKVGAQIAKLVGVEAAMVTTGAAGALLLGTAAAVTRGDRKLVQRLPDLTGMKNEVILQKAHHTCYDNQLTDVGVKLIDVETAGD